MKMHLFKYILCILVLIQIPVFGQKILDSNGIQVTLPEDFERVPSRGSGFATFRRGDNFQIVFANGCQTYADSTKTGLNEGMEIDLCFELLLKKMESNFEPYWSTGVIDTVIYNRKCKWSVWKLRQKEKEYYVVNILVKGRQNIEVQLSGYLGNQKEDLVVLDNVLSTYRELSIPSDPIATYVELKTSLLKEYCKCLQQGQSKEAIDILYSRSGNCMSNYFNDNYTKISVLIASDKKDDSKSLNDRRNEWEKKLAYEIIDELIIECDVYRNALINYKKELIANLKVGVSKDEANKSIEKYLTREPDIKPGIDMALYYSSIGVMYEYVDSDKKALKYYEKSMEAFPTTAAKGLHVLLKQERKIKRK